LLVVVEAVAQLMGSMVVEAVAPADIGLLSLVNLQVVVQVLNHH
jgi:hypothetical protein